MPKYDDLNELKELIVHNLDVVEFLDIIEIDMPLLVTYLENEIEEYHEKLVRACR